MHISRLTFAQTPRPSPPLGMHFHPHTIHQQTTNYKPQQVPLGKNINFLVGENGSGKSAVLVGIQLGLGGKTGNTGRGGVSTVVMHGKESALVRITLYNEGQYFLKTLPHRHLFNYREDSRLPEGNPPSASLFRSHVVLLELPVLLARFSSFS